MNPEDFDKLYEGYEKSTQLELDLDDYNYSLDNKTYTIDIDSSATSTSPSTVTFGDFTTTAGDVLSEEIKAEEFNARLDKMEKMLGIIKPDEVIEENVFGEIDSNLETMATHMSATQALETLVGELQAISGGTKVLHQALKNIVSDMKVGVYNNTKEE